MRRARVIASDAGAASKCLYCGRDLVPSDLAAAGDVPGFFVPFSLTRGQAEESLRNHLKGKAYLAPGFDPKVERMQRLFVPYYVHDVFVHGEVGFVGSREVQEGKHRHTYYYATRIHGRGEFVGIATDASSHMPDGLMENIAPFRAGKAVRLRPAHVSGFLFEVPDEPMSKVSDRARELASGSFLEAADEYMRDAPVGTFTRSVFGLTVSQETDAKLEYISGPTDIGHEAYVLEGHLVALPVWLLYCTWEGEDYLFAVNGQTGKCAGDLPMDVSRQQKDKRLTSRLESIGGLRIIGFVLFFVIALFNSMVSAAYPGLSASLMVLLFIPLLLIFIGGSKTLEEMGEEQREREAHRLAEVRTASKATSSANIQERQEVRFSLRMCKYAGCVFKHYALAMVEHATWDSDWRHTVMIEYANDACDELCSKASARGPVVRRTKGIPLDLFVPYDQTPISVCDGALADGVHGFCITEAGLWCCPQGFGENACFVSWEEYAWAAGPMTRGNQPILYAGSKPIACLTAHQALREELMLMYAKLRAKAREVYPWDLVVSTKPDIAAALVMAEAVREACGPLVARSANVALLPSGKTMSFLEINATEMVYLAHEYLNGPLERVGFAITSEGFVCREPDALEKPYHVDWKTLSTLKEPTLQGRCVCAGGTTLVCYSGDSETLNALFQLCRDLRIRAIEAYGGKVGLRIRRPKW